MSKRKPEKKPSASTSTPSKRAPAPPWSAEEDAAIRRLCEPKRSRAPKPRLPRAALLAALPGRGWSAIVARRRKVLRWRGGTHWAAAEDRALFESWQSLGSRAILAALPGRSWRAICKHARDLGLPTVPQGWVTFRSEYMRLGCSRAEAEAVVAWAAWWAPLAESLCWWGYYAARMGGEPVVAPADGYDGGAVETRLHTTASTARLDVDRRRLLVEEGALEEALTRRMSWEPVAAAAERLAVERQQLERCLAVGRWAARGGEIPRLLPPGWADAALEESGVRPRGRSAKALAKAFGVTENRVRRALAAAGVATRGRGAPGYHAEEDVRRGLALVPPAGGRPNAAAGAAALAAVERGLSARAAAVEFGVPERTVSAQMRRLRGPVRSREPRRAA